MRSSEGVHGMPEHKQDDWGNTFLWLLIAAGTIAFWGAVVWYTGLYGLLVANVTKDMLGYAAAGAFLLIFLLATTLRDPRR